MRILLAVILMVVFLPLHSEILQRISILPFKDESNSKAHSFLIELLPRSIYITTIKEYKYEYIEISLDDGLFRKLFPSGVDLDDFKSLIALIRKKNLDWVVAGSYKVKGLNIRMNIVVIGFWSGKFLKFRFSMEGESGVMVYDLIDRISQKIVSIFKKYLPRRNLQEKKKIIEELKKKGLIGPKKITLWRKISGFVSKYTAPVFNFFRYARHRSIYFGSGFSFLNTPSSVPNYIEIGNYVPLKKMKNSLYLNFGYLGIKRAFLLFLNSFLLDSSLYYGRSDTIYRNSNINFRFHYMFFDIGFSIGYSFHIVKRLQFTVYTGIGITSQLFQEIGGSFFAGGVWGYPQLGVSVFYPIYSNKIGIVLDSKTKLYIYLDKFLFNTGVMIGIYKDI